MQTNKAVLETASATRKMLNQITFKMISYIGHALRGDKYQLLQLSVIQKGLEVSAESKHNCLGIYQNRWENRVQNSFLEGPNTVNYDGCNV